MLPPPRSPRRTSWNPRGTLGGSLVEPWWNPRGTLPQGRPRPPRSLSGLRPQSFQLLGEKTSGTPGFEALLMLQSRVATATEHYWAVSSSRPTSRGLTAWAHSTRRIDVCCANSTKTPPHNQKQFHTPNSFFRQTYAQTRRFPACGQAEKMQTE